MCLLEWALIQSDLFCYERKEMGDTCHRQAQNNDSVLSPDNQEESHRRTKPANTVTSTFNLQNCVKMIFFSVMFV